MISNVLFLIGIGAFASGLLLILVDALRGK